MRGWYLPHYPVVHPQKADKLRVVLELIAATLAARVDVALRQELGKMVSNSVFW